MSSIAALSAELACQVAVKQAARDADLTNFHKDQEEKDRMHQAKMDKLKEQLAELQKEHSKAGVKLIELEQKVAEASPFQLDAAPRGQCTVHALSEAIFDGT